LVVGVGVGAPVHYINGCRFEDWGVELVFMGLSGVADFIFDGLVPSVVDRRVKEWLF
jgi:hypothetical protein